MTSNNQPGQSPRDAANRENAKLSTGPKSEAGKAASSQNATTHGLTSAHVYLRNEADRAQYKALEAAFDSQLLPKGPVERFHFNRLMAAAWNLERCDKLQAEIRSARWADPLLDVCANKTIRNIEIYRRRNERTYQLESKILRELQSESLFRTVSFGADAGVPISILASVQQLRQRLTTDESNTVRRVKAAEALARSKSKPQPQQSENAPVARSVPATSQVEQSKPIAPELNPEIQEMLDLIEAENSGSAVGSAQTLRSAA